MPANSIESAILSGGILCLAAQRIPGARQRRWQSKDLVPRSIKAVIVVQKERARPRATPETWSRSECRMTFARRPDVESVHTNKHESCLLHSYQSSPFADQPQLRAAHGAPSQRRAALGDALNSFDSRRLRSTRVAVSRQTSPTGGALAEVLAEVFCADT